MASPLLAQDDDGNDRGRGFTRFSPPGYWSNDYSEEDGDEENGDEAGEVECLGGYVFVDGKYLPPPYLVRGTNEGIFINDQQVYSNPPVSQQRSRRGRSWQSRDDQYANSASYVSDVLEQDLVVVFFADRPLSVIADMGTQCDLFRQLTHTPGKSLTAASLVDHFAGNIDKAIVDKWVGGFEATPEFQSRASEMIQEYENSEARAIAEVSATHRLNQFSYPLSVFGMIMTVLATGHLLSHRPPSTKVPTQTDSSPETMSVVVWSLALIALLSALDLAWTILASQAGQMRELNPIGAQMIQDPAKLIFFKFAVIGGAIGLLYALRRYPHAQAGAWWAVLICTLLTVRWLTFNSLFMA